MSLQSSAGRVFVGIALVGSALALAGCQSNTYGTGKSPGMQTVQDLASIAVLGGAKNEPIDYKPRAGIVAPPNTATLPAPGTGQQTAALTANWPNDPDVQTAKLRADAAERELTGAPTPRFSLPAQERTQPIVAPDPQKEAMGTPERRAAARKMFADARGAVAVDETGAPVRRYLSDPPSAYRLPDPSAPVEIVDKPAPKRKFKWWWQN